MTGDLVDERDHLLRSLDDLDAEYQAGDLSDDDYRALRADYTTRAAAAIRAIESDPGGAAAPSAVDGATAADVERHRLVRIVGWVVVVVMVAATAGVLVARFSGSRATGESVSGDIRTSIREQLFAAQQAFGAGDPDGAIAIYDDILEQDPANAEALTYKGWMVNIDGDREAAAVLLADAVAADPDYPDARVFAASLALDAGDAEAAAEHLAVLDSLDAPPFVLQLVDQFGLRTRIEVALDPDSLVARRALALEAVAAVLLVDDPPPFADTDLTVDQVLLAAEALAERGEALDALELVDHALVDRPDDPDLHAGRGWLMARLPSEELQLIGLESLDEALTLDPDHPQALVYRSFLRFELGDADGARADLAAFDALAEPPEELLALLEAAALREALA